MTRIFGEILHNEKEEEKSFFGFSFLCTMKNKEIGKKCKKKPKFGVLENNHGKGRKYLYGKEKITERLLQNLNRMDIIFSESQGK